VLHRITGALAATGLDARTAHVSTLGADVVDAFHVVGPEGGKLTDPALRVRVEQDVLSRARLSRPPAGDPRAPGRMPEPGRRRKMLVDHRQRAPGAPRAARRATCRG
jgi:hypothetical protein